MAAEDIFDFGDLEDDENDQEDRLVHMLTEQMINEKHAPELLDPKEELLNKMMDKISEQEDRIENCDSKMEKMMYELELKRIRFMLNDWNRSRIIKLQKHIFNYIPDNQNSQSQHHERMRPKEMEFGMKYKKIVQKHLYDTNLSKIPEAYQQIPQALYKPPDKDNYVFIKCKRDLPDMVLDEQGEETVNLSERTVVVAPYRAFEGLLQEGHVHLV